MPKDSNSKGNVINLSEEMLKRQKSDVNIDPQFFEDVLYDSLFINTPANDEEDMLLFIELEEDDESPEWTD